MLRKYLYEYLDLYEIPKEGFERYEDKQHFN